MCELTGIGSHSGGCGSLSGQILQSENSTIHSTAAERWINHLRPRKGLLQFGNFFF